jgi:hypothetical protein
MLKRTIIKRKVDKTNPNSVKMSAYKKSMPIARTAFPHFKPFHMSMRGVASPFLKMLFMIRMTERTPSPVLDQKKIKPDPGLVNVPSPRSMALTATKIEIANQKNPLMTCFRSIILPLLSLGMRSFGIHAEKIFSNDILTAKVAEERGFPLAVGRTARGNK